MSDVDRTITTLQNLINGARNKGLKTTTVFISTLSKCMALLKEKEPMAPEMEGGGSNWFVVCGDCHAVISEGDKFCRHCGREVLWSGFNLSGVQEGVRDPAPAAVAVQDQQ